MADKKELANQTIEKRKAIPKFPIIKLLKTNIEKLARKIIVLDIQIFPHFVKGNILLFASMNVNEAITTLKIINPIPNNVV